jgi:hypothetical protein
MPARRPPSSIFHARSPILTWRPHSQSRPPTGFCRYPVAGQEEKTATAAARVFQAGAQLGQFTFSADEGAWLRIVNKNASA